MAGLIDEGLNLINKMGHQVADLGGDLSKATVSGIEKLSLFVENELASNLPSVDTNASIEGKDFSLGQSKYDLTQRKFPFDLGEPGYNGHYMVININVSNYSQLTSTINTPNGQINVTTKLNNELSKVDSLRSSIDNLYSQSGGQGITSIQGGKLGVGYYAPRQTRRIAESIALFMPNTVAYTSYNEHEDVSLTSILTGAIKQIPGIGGLAGSAIDLGTRASQVLHAPINPRTEVIFSNTALRQFTFDFLFAPSNESESFNLQQIIKTLRYHAAPEFNGLSWSLDAVKSLLWIPPSEFDITFYHRGLENTVLPRINTCVCKQVDVDYAPTGIYSTFSNGYPVQVRVQLTLHETEVIHKLRVLQGF